MEPKEKLYKMREASSILGVHPNTIRRWEKQGHIRVARTERGHRKIPESEINRIIGGFKPKDVEKYTFTSVDNEKLSIFLDFVFSYHKDDWDLVRKAIIIRDKYCCQECGGKEALVVHHIDGSGRNDLDNLITLCQKCHYKKHTGPMYKYEEYKTTEEPLTTVTEKISTNAAPPFSTPSGISRWVILDALAPAGLAQRTAFGELLSVASALKKFSFQDLVTRARCPDIVAKAFCEQMEKLGYIAVFDGSFELKIEVAR